MGEKLTEGSSEANGKRKLNQIIEKKVDEKELDDEREFETVAEEVKSEADQREVQVKIEPMSDQREFQIDVEDEMKEIKSDIDQREVYMKETRDQREVQSQLKTDADHRKVQRGIEDWRVVQEAIHEADQREVQVDGAEDKREIKKEIPFTKKGSKNKEYQRRVEKKNTTRKAISKKGNRDIREWLQAGNKVKKEDIEKELKKIREEMKTANSNDIAKKLEKGPPNEVLADNNMRMT